MRSCEMAERALVIVKHIPSAVLQARTRICLLYGQMSRKDITIARVEKLKTLFEEFKLHIKTICKHPLIVEYPGGRDYEENTSWPGGRICALCCFAEEGTFRNHARIDSETDFKVLVECDERIFCWGSSSELEKILRRKDYWGVASETIIEFFLDKRMLTVQEGQPLKHIKYHFLSQTFE